MNNLGKDGAVARQLDRKLFVKVARHNDKRMKCQVTSLLPSRIHRRALMLNWLLASLHPAHRLCCSSSGQVFHLHVKPPWTLQHRHTQKSVSQLILHSVQLTVKINRNGPQRRGKWLVARVSIWTYLSAIFNNQIIQNIVIAILVLCYKNLCV